MNDLLPRENDTGLIPKKQPLIAALYARVSTSRQEIQETIESQIAEIRAKIDTDGNLLPHENIFLDDGWTGEMLQRPGLDAMRDAALEGRLQILYVYDRGRLSRVFAYQEIIIEELADRGIQFVTLRDVKAETPEEKVLQAMQGVFHEYERVKIAERMRRGKLYKTRLGILINGQAKYGWNYVRKTKTTPAHYEVNEEETEVVGKIFYWVGVERISLREVIRRLYDLGIPPKRRKSEFWTKGPIVRMLRCESYVTGEVYYNKSEAVVAKKPIKNDKYRKVKKNSRRIRPIEEWIPFKVQPILKDRALFDKVQKILDYNQKYARKNRKYDYLVSDRAFCICGNKRVGDGSTKGGHFYYRCAERVYKFPLPRKCDAKGVNAVILDAMLWKELVRILKNPAILRAHAQKWLNLQKNNEVYYKEKERIEVFIDKIDEEEKRYAKAYGAGTLEFEQFQELMKETKKRKISLERQLREVNASMSHEAIDIGMDELLDEVKKVLQSIDFTNKIQVVRDFVEKVIIGERSRVEVWAHVPVLATQKLGYGTIGRNCGSAECGEVNII